MFTRPMVCHRCHLQIILVFCNCTGEGMNERFSNVNFGSAWPWSEPGPDDYEAHRHACEVHVQIDTPQQLRTIVTCIRFQKTSGSYGPT
eukprot:6660590-Pyramimonas_sp.AAC.1